MPVSRRRPFRFGVACVSPVATGREWRERARRIEDQGYAVLVAPDHVDETKMAPMPLLAAAAEATSALRIGSLVLNNDFRHPVLLAKEAATLDLLSEGRLELGLGAGWASTDYERTGIRCDGPATRIERLAEAVSMLKGLFTAGPVSVAGLHYRVEGVEGSPKPVQQPHPPILIGGSGRRVLGLAAREANIVALNWDVSGGSLSPHTVTTATEAAVAEKVAWVKEAAGERFGALELQLIVYFLTVTDTPADAAANIASLFGADAATVGASPHALLGSVNGLVDELQRRREAHGISYFTVLDVAADAFAPVVARLAGT